MRLSTAIVLGFLFSIHQSVYSQTLDLYPTDDTELDQATASTNLGSVDHFLVKPWSPSWSSRAVIKFDLSALSGCTITSAILTLWESHTSGFTRQIDVHRLTSSWVESTATWNSPWATTGGDFDAMAVANFTCVWTGVLDDNQVDLTNSVKDFVDGSYTNHGWLLKMATEDATQQSWGFHSKETATSSKMPLLSVTYSGCAALPIELIKFEASVSKSNQINLSWQTASETNNDYFTVERSADGIKWEELFIMKGAGNSSSIIYYESVDPYPYPGISFYRLKQTDFDGQFSHSEIVSVQSKSNLRFQLAIFPNPVKDIATIEITNNQMVGLRIFNMFGQDITKSIPTTKFSNYITLDFAEMPSGTYIIETMDSRQLLFKD